MAHQIETIGSRASFVSAQVPAWHRLGTVLPDRFTAEEAMTHANLGGWNVRKIGLQTVAEIGASGVTAPVLMPEFVATVRTNPHTGQVEPLGVVGSGYHVIQNEDHAEVLNRLVDDSGAIFETAGSLHGGRQVFLSMKMPETMLIGGVDAVDLYLVALNSHDGSGAFRLLVSPIRVVCANTQAAALRHHRSSFSIRHTSGAKARIEQARQALGLTFAYATQFQAEAERMISATIATDEFEQIIGKAFPESTSTTSRGRTAATDRVAKIKQLLRFSPTLPDEFRKTRYGAYQAITEYVDHHAPTRTRTGASAARAERAVLGSGVGIKSAAFDLLRV